MKEKEEKTRKGRRRKTTSVFFVKSEDGAWCKSEEARGTAYVSREQYTIERRLQKPRKNEKEETVVRFRKKPPANTLPVVVYDKEIVVLSSWTELQENAIRLLIGAEEVHAVQLCVPTFVLVPKEQQGS